MKILYDYPGFERETSGAARYFLEVIKNISSHNEISLASKYLNNISAADYFHKDAKFLKGFTFKGKTKLEIILQRRYAKNKINKKKFDIFHATGQHFYYQKELGNKPLVITVHDLIYEFFFREGKIDNKRLELYSRADRIITVSNHTKKDLLKLYPSLDENKISVIYHGASVLESDIIKPKQENYILYVGTRKENYKNFRFFVSSIKPLLDKYDDITILCTGLPFTDDELIFFNELNLTDRIKSTGFVSDAELYGLYSSALVFVFPSFYEGFGIPILEAFQNNCPACISNASCFPEIAGDAVDYFDPFDKESILNSITKIIEDKSFAQTLIKKGKERIRKYSWEKCAQQTEEVYKSLL